MTDNRLLISVDRGSSVTVRAVGELDYVNCAEFGALLHELVSDGHGPVALDLAGLDFIDSSGFRVLLKAAYQSSQRGKPITISSMTPQISHLLRVSAVEDLFIIRAGGPDEPALSPSSDLDPPHAFRIPAKISACRDARDAVCRFAKSVGAGQTACDDIRLAVGEAVSNAVRHGADCRDTISVTCHTDGKIIIIALRYPSETFDPQGVPIPDIEDPCEGGMGIHFMRLVMDSVTYSFENGHVVLTLVKRIDSA